MYEAEEALTLACLGFFIPAASAQTDYSIVKCSFCRRSFTFGSRFAEFESYSTVDSRIAKLLWRQSVLCSTCTTAICNNGDNRPLSMNGLKNYSYNYISSVLQNSDLTLSSYPIEPLLYWHLNEVAFPMGLTTNQIQRSVDLKGESPKTTMKSMQYRSACGEAGIRANTPDINDDRYYHYRAEFEVELFSEFNALEHCWSEYSNLEGYLPRLKILDYMIGDEPARPDLWPLAQREQTFIDLFWSARAHFVSPSFVKIAEAGFYYTGERDRVRCFWCSLELDSWDPGNDPWREHARFSPHCPWLLRSRGRYFVRKVILQSVTPAAVEQDKTLILTCWEDAHGMQTSII